MKKWSVWQWICFMFVIMICYVFMAYFTGMFILKQATNSANADLRRDMVKTLTMIAMQILAVAYIKITGKDKDDEIKK